MKYLIKLEDRDSGREAFVECPANMLLEELSIKIKVALQLPYSDYGAHCFLMRGKVYVPDPWAISELWGDYNDITLPMSETFQHIINYPRERDIRSTEVFRLSQVYTVIGSALTYDQKTSTRWSHVRCTLLQRIPQQFV